MEDAKARILAIVDPPKAELGAVYNGRVVSITKFGAFVNILPGRDGLVHISKLGRGKRINNVEDVLTLGQELEVRVDDIDDKGKVSLTPVGDGPEPTGDSSGGSSSSGSSSNGGGRSGGPVSVSFEDAFDSEIASELGDLGPGGSAGSDDRGDRRGGDRRGGGGRDRGPRRHR